MIPPISSRNYSIGQVEIEDEVIYHKTEYRERRDHFAYFACSEPLAGFDTQRETFLGAYRGWDAPLVVASGNSCNSIANGWQPIGSQHVKVQLKAGEQTQILFLLGYQENPRDDKFDPPGSLFVGALLLVAWEHSQWTELGYKMTRLQAERTAVEADNRHLRLELEMLWAPQRIEALAIQRLHVVAPSQTEAVVLELVREAAKPPRTLVARR